MPRLPVDRWRLCFSVTQQAFISGLLASPGTEPHVRAGGTSEWRDSFAPAFRGDTCFLPETIQTEARQVAEDNLPGTLSPDTQASPPAFRCGSLTWSTTDGRVGLLGKVAGMLPGMESLMSWIWLFLDVPRHSASLGKWLGLPRLWLSSREGRPVGL